MPCTCVNADEYISCAGFNKSGVDSSQYSPIFKDSEVSVYADRVGAQGGTKGNEVRCFAIACLRFNRLLYAEDCSGASKVNIGGAAVGQQIAEQAASFIPVVGDIVAKAISYIPILHHAAAVAKEHTVLCGVTMAYNQFAADIEQRISNKQTPLQDAIVQLQAAHDKLQKDYLSTILKGQNAAYYFSKALDSLLLFNKEVVFPSLVPGTAQNLLGKVGQNKYGVVVIGGAAAAAAVLL